MAILVLTKNRPLVYFQLAEIEVSRQELDIVLRKTSKIFTYLVYKTSYFQEFIDENRLGFTLVLLTGYISKNLLMKTG